jgi:hypothetical protein
MAKIVEMKIKYDEIIKKTFEAQTGCQLYVMIQALLNGVYESYIDFGDNNTVKTRHRKVRGIEQYGLSVINTICGSPECDEFFEYKDYKKTWWLKEDRSE